MMKVKSYLHLILVVLVCAFVLTACGADKTDPDSQPVADTDASEEFDDADDTGIPLFIQFRDPQRMVS